MGHPSLQNPILKSPQLFCWRIKAHKSTTSKKDGHDHEIQNYGWMPNQDQHQREMLHQILNIARYKVCFSRNL